MWNHSILQNGELSFRNGWNSISQYFFSQTEKCRFVLFQYSYVFLCAKFGDLKPTIDENQLLQIQTCFWARRRNKILQGNCDFISTKCFINVNRSSGSTDCAAENSKLELCIGTNVGTNQAKIEKMSISRAIWLEFLRSLVRAIRCEANKINLLLVERPIGSRAIKMLSDLLLRARGPALHAAAANART